MNPSIPENLLHDLSRFIALHTGLSFPAKKWNVLTKGLTAAAYETGFESPAAYARKILESASPAESLEPLVGRLTIGETYFLRDKNIFQALQDHIMRGLIEHPRRGEKSIRFWSAGCATGEEAYSIAILIDRMGDLLKGWDIHIIGTDVNREFLRIAEQGIYTRWSLRETPDHIIRQYFIPHSDNRFELLPRIRRQAVFKRLNFADPNYKKILGHRIPMDVIFCRNVLMYHDAMSRAQVINCLVDLLVDNGWLITGPAESGFVDTDVLSPVRFSHATFFRKGPPRKEEKYPLTHSNTRRRGDAAPGVSNRTSLKPAAGRQNNRRITDTTDTREPKDAAQHTYEAAVADYEKGGYAPAAQKLSRILGNGQFRKNSFLMQTESMTLLTRCYANLGDLENAAYWCQKAIESEKLNPELYFLLSNIHQAGNDPDAAIRELKRALYLDPDFIMAHFHMGFLLKQKGRHEEGQKHFLNSIPLLKAKDPEEILPQSEGMTAARMLETVRSLTG